MFIGVDPQTHKATRIPLFSSARPHMRVFHMSWMAFFLAFFGWFGIAPMMAIVRDDLQLTKAEIGNTVIASVAVTIVARLVVGWLCDRIGPRITYSALLIIGSIPGDDHRVWPTATSLFCCSGWPSASSAPPSSSRSTTPRSCLLPTWRERPTQPPPDGATWAVA